MRTLLKLLSHNRGLATIEYSLLAGFIALGLVTSLGEIGNSLADRLDYIHDELTDASKGNPGNGKGKGNGNGKGSGKGKGKA